MENLEEPFHTFQEKYFQLLSLLKGILLAISKNPDYKDVHSFSISIKGKDVTERLVDLKIYQDMFCPYTIATLDMFDYTSYVDEVKVGELVTIKIETKQKFQETDDKFELALEIYDIQNRFVDKDRSQGFTLQLASKQFMKDIQSRMIQTFTNKPVISILEECVSKVGASIKEIVDKPPTNKISFVAPNISPLIAANMALRFTSPRTDFFLVPTNIRQSGNNEYSLLSLFDIMKKEKVAIFTQDVHNREVSRFQNQNLQFRNPVIQPLDNLQTILAGYNASTLSTLDVFKRKWGKKDKKFMGNVNSKSHIAYMPVTKEGFDQGVSIPEMSESWLSQRKNNFYKVIQYPVMFSTFGFAKSHKWLGKPVELHLHNHDTRQRTNNPNQLFKGVKFLCTAVTHHINNRFEYRNSWRMNNWEMEQNQG